MRFILLLLILTGCFQCAAQKRLVVIGNTGELGKKAGQFLDAVKNTITLDSNTIVLYLGNTGDTAIVRREASLVQNTSANAWFIPGYDEWVRGNRPGFRSVLAWQHYIESLGSDHIKVFPKDGCPGPVHIPLNSKTEMLLMDTQWWLHDNDKPGMECNCQFRTRQEVLEDVESAVMGQFGKLVVFVGYHPMSNSGVHSGTFGIKQHIFPFTDSRRLSKFYLPLPLIGSLYPFLRSTITSRQDMNNQQYQVLAETGMGTTPGVHAVLKEHAHTIFIAGQEHSLQLLQENGTYSIVSGASRGRGRVRHTKRVRYAQKDAGFSVVEIGENGSARTEFYKVKDGVATKSYATGLCQNAEEAPFHDTATRPMTTEDSVLAVANGEMNEAGKVKRFFNGDNYREEWGADVKMKVFHIDREKGGLKIAAIGGGHESITLHLDDSTGKRWILRPVRKSFDKVVPEGFRHTFVHSIVDDIGSAQDPYGALVVPGLIDPLHIPHAHPEVVFIPNDTALGIFRPVYANTVAQLEERKPALNKNELVATNEMVHDLVDKPDYRLDQKGFLKARLIDFLIADFDRHHSQWTWGTIDSAHRKTFYVVPKDRDQAFYNNDGLIIDIARRGPYAFMTNFTPRIKKVVNLAAIGVPLDKFCLNELDKSDWQAALSEFRNALDDTVLKSALMRMPPEIYALKGARMEQTLSARRDIIATRGLQYYKHLARDVDVPGDNGNNIFKVTDGTNGALVEVYGTDENGQSILRYSRQFDPRVTKEVRLYGLNGNDRFDISSHTRIKFRVIGGRGNDTFNVGGRSRAWLYDRKDERNTILSARHTRSLFYHDAPFIKFPVKETVHSKIELPKLAVAYNEDDGILLGGGIGYKTFAFQKKPYASYQVLTGTWAFDTKAYQVKYRGTFNNVVRHYDLVLVGDYADPALYYFFGYGNETKKSATHPIEYYRARYDFISADILLRRRFYNDSLISVAVGPSVYHYWNSNNMIKGRLLEYPSTVGLDSADVFALKAYGGGKLVVTLNNLNSDLLPARGVRWVSELTIYEPLNKNSSPFTRLTSKMDMYATLSRKSAVRAAIHLGGGQIFSENFEYFQAMTLGGDSYLRGFRRNRFAGSAMLYASTELSVRLATFNAYLLKGDFGVTGFNDVGRVWMRNEKSAQWHDGYGGGLYMTPFNVCFVSLFVGFSHEEQMFYAGLGTRFGIL